MKGGVVMFACMRCMLDSAIGVGVGEGRQRPRVKSSVCVTCGGVTCGEADDVAPSTMYTVHCRVVTDWAGVPEASIYVALSCCVSCMH